MAAALAVGAGWLAGTGVGARRGSPRRSRPRSRAAAAALLVALRRIVTFALRRRFDDDRLRTAALAITDELTGVGTRRFVLDRLEEELGRARRYGRVVSCALLDLDGLGRVNEAPAPTGATPCCGPRPPRCAARSAAPTWWAGSATTSCSSSCRRPTSPSARLISDRLRLAVASLQVLHAGMTLSATASLGVVTYDPAAEREAPEVEGMLRRADQALFKAKSAGRNRVALEALRGPGCARQPGLSGPLDPPAAQQHLAVVDHRRLARGGRLDRRVEGHLEAVRRPRRAPGPAPRQVAGADLHLGRQRPALQRPGRRHLPARPPPP